MTPQRTNAAALVNEDSRVRETTRSPYGDRWPHIVELLRDLRRRGRGESADIRKINFAIASRRPVRRLRRSGTTPFPAKHPLCRSVGPSVAVAPGNVDSPSDFGGEGATTCRTRWLPLMVSWSPQGSRTESRKLRTKPSTTSRIACTPACVTVRSGVRGPQGRAMTAQSCAGSSTFPAVTPKSVPAVIGRRSGARASAMKDPRTPSPWPVRSRDQSTTQRCQARAVALPGATRNHRADTSSIGSRVGAPRICLLKKIARHEERG